MKYQDYIEEKAVETIAATRGRQRAVLREFVRSLAVDPFNDGDFSEHDRIGRRVFTKLEADYAISYWPDHSVNEIKVFEISKADR